MYTYRSTYKIDQQMNKNEGINPVYTTLRIKDELILLTYKDDWQVFSTVCSELYTIIRFQVHIYNVWL